MDIKHVLKNARDEIDKKQFNEAISLIKSVLKQDKNNYMALVLLGVALQNADQAPFAFKKAINVNKDKALAWQGLASYYEKSDTAESSRELITVYNHLLDIEMDPGKFKDICSRFVSAAVKLNNFKCCELMYNKFAQEADSVKSSVVYLTFTDILVKIELIRDNDLLDLFKTLVKHYNDKNEAFICKYLELALITNGLNCMLELSKGFITDNDSALKFWILDMFIKSTILEENVEKSYITDVKYIEKLNEHDPNSIEETNILVQSALLYQKEDFYNSYYLIKSLPLSEKEILYVLFGNLCLKLRRWLEAERISSYLINSNDPILSQRGKKILLIALSNQTPPEKCERAILLKNELDPAELGEKEYAALFMAYLQLQKIPEAQDCLTHFKDSPDYFPLYSELLKVTGKHTEAVQVLEAQKSSSPLCYFKIGLHHWTNGDYEAALLPLLHAARVDPHNYLIFVYLGDYYTLIDTNLEKAKKCFLKAFTLNPESSQAGKCLSNTYRKLQNWEANLEFLKTLSNMKTSEDSWTWLELGLHHLGLEEWDEAILNLRTFVRFNPDDIEAWESLADAYYSRGSFTSALKCYKRVTELDVERKYSIVQIGAVQCILGDFNDALATYKLIKGDYFLPALKGMADVHLAIANEKFSQNFYGGCQEHAQATINLITSAIGKGNNQLVCLWSALSAAATIISRLPTKYRCLFVDKRFFTETNEDSKVYLVESDVFSLAVRCYCRAINLSSSNNAYLYHELATVYLDCYTAYNNTPDVYKAFAAIKRCLLADRTNWQYWNLLGAICMTKDIKKYSLAQHAFIKAISLEMTNSSVWSNLGVCYLHFEKIMLANKTLQMSQRFDPTYCQSWIAQAIIAELVGDEDTMDLFRHSSQLGFHKESARGYAEWVCKTLMEFKNKKVAKIEYCISNMHAIPVACDLMTRLIEYEQENPFCLNTLGVLQEKMGLLRSASKLYEKASTFVKPEFKSIVLLNYGRSLYRIGNYNKAMIIYKLISEASLNCACGLALSVWKLGNYSEAYEIYGTALQWLTNNEREKSELCVALATMSYNLKGNETKSHLFRSIQSNQNTPSVSGLLSLFSFGMLTSDQNLSKLVLGELSKLPNKEKYTHYVGFFEAYILLKNNNFIEALRKLSTHIHIFPNNANLWKYLSLLCSIDICKNASVASKSAQKVIALGNVQTNNIQCYRTASVAEMLKGNFNNSKVFAQKAIRVHPDSADNWAMLICVLLFSKTLTDTAKLISLIEHVKSNLHPSKTVSNWLEFCQRHCMASS